MTNIDVPPEILAEAEAVVDGQNDDTVLDAITSYLASVINDPLRTDEEVFGLLVATLGLASRVETFPAVAGIFSGMGLALAAGKGLDEVTNTGSISIATITEFASATAGVGALFTNILGVSAAPFLAAYNLSYFGGSLINKIFGLDDIVSDFAFELFNVDIRLDDGTTVNGTASHGSHAALLYAIDGSLSTKQIADIVSAIDNGDGKGGMLAQDSDFGVERLLHFFEKLFLKIEDPQPILDLDQYFDRTVDVLTAISPLSAIACSTIFSVTFSSLRIRVLIPPLSGIRNTLPL